jgi:hypothetical protein
MTQRVVSGETAIRVIVIIQGNLRDVRSLILRVRNMAHAPVVGLS